MTFAVIEIENLITGTELNVIAHVKTTDQAISICQDMNNNNPDRKFIWIMLPKVR